MQTTLLAYQERVNSQLAKFLNTQRQPQQTHSTHLTEAIRYATLNQGKRIRPALVYAVGEALTIPLEKLDAAACAIELMHSYSLVHDDLPAMDNDDLRRGQPTCHIQYNEATAILVGDAQQTLAFSILSQQADNQSIHQSPEEPQNNLRMIQILSHACGPQGMILGQYQDILAENSHISLAQLQSLHQNKTGALLQAALLMGAVPSANYVKLKADLAQLGTSIGLAFQVQDDILDIESDTLTLGKTQGRDCALNKTTYPSIMGLDEAKAWRDQLLEQALQQYHQLPFKSPFLEQLVLYIGQRNY